MKNYRKISPKKVRKILKNATQVISKYQKLCYQWEQTNDESLLIIGEQRADIRRYKNKNKMLWTIIYILSTLLFLSMVYGLM